METEALFTEQLADFVLRCEPDLLTEKQVGLLKRHVLDTLGCAIGALGAEPIRQIRSLVDDFGGSPMSTLLGGGQTSAPQAAFVNGAAVRYLDSMDNILAKESACHPSDNFAAVLAVAEMVGSTGLEFLTALAIAYQVQGRMTEEGSFLVSGLNHTTQLSFSVAAACAKLLKLDRKQIINAIAIAGADAPELLVVQAQPVSQWKGLSSADRAMRAVYATFLAKKGITGPVGVVDGPMGLDQLLKHPLKIDWSKEKLDIIERTNIKKYNAEVHSQSAIECAIKMREEFAFEPSAINVVIIRTFKEAYNIIGGGSFGDRGFAHNKEEADHNLKYVVASALLEGRAEPEPSSGERIGNTLVRDLMAKTEVKPKVTFTWEYPTVMPVDIEVKLANGKVIERKQMDYDGFYRTPMAFENVAAKFNGLAEPLTEKAVRQAFVERVLRLDELMVGDLVELFGRVKAPAIKPQPAAAEIPGSTEVTWGL